MKIVLGLAIALLVGCASPTAPSGEWDMVTPGGIEVATGGHAIDAGALDRAFAEQAACFDYHGVDRPWVRIEEPLFYLHGCGGYYAGGEPVHGQAGAYGVILFPDICAAPHEFAHWIHYKMYGWFGDDYSGVCAL